MAAGKNKRKKKKNGNTNGALPFAEPEKLMKYKIGMNFFTSTRGERSKMPCCE